MTEREEALLDRGCSCHIAPPCSFCTSLTEEEGEQYWAGGIKALRAFWNQLDVVEDKVAPDIIVLRQLPGKEMQ